MHRWNLLQTLSYRLRQRARDERGQALVEFAIVLPVLILIIMGILYFGRYMNYSNQMTQLAEEGARWASVNYNPTSGASLHDYIASQPSGELAGGSSDVTGGLVKTAGGSGVYIYYPTTNTVKDASGTYNVVGNSIRVCVVAVVQYPFLGMTSTIGESATMRIEVIDDGTNPFPIAAAASIPTQCPTS